MPTMPKPTEFSTTADTVERTWDLERVATVLLHPEVRPFIGDDYTPDDWYPTLDSLYLMVPGVVFTLRPINSTLWEAHVGAMPGVETVEAGKDAVRWMFANTPCRSLIAMCPEDNPRAAVYASRIGMTRKGNLSRAFLRGGVLRDLEIYGVNV